MKKIKYFCDLCGKELPDYCHNRGSLTGAVTVDGRVSYNMNLEELCNECSSKFWDLYYSLKIIHT
jgi:hypothetical protein